MAFNDALDLRTAVVEAVQDQNITDVWPRLVKLAEATINRRLRAREQIATTTLNVANGFAYLPGDFMEVLSLYDATGRELTMQPIGMAVRNGTQGFYAVDSDRILAKEDGAFTLKYYAALPSVSGTLSASNWALLRWPQVYLYTVATEAARYLRNPEMAREFAAVADQEIAAIAAQDASARYGRAKVRFSWVTP